MLNIAWPAVLVLPALPDAAAKVLQVDGPAAVADIERTTVAALHERTSAEIDQRAHRRAEAGIGGRRLQGRELDRSEEHTSELQSLMRISYAVVCLKKKKLHHQPRQPK